MLFKENNFPHKQNYRFNPFRGFTSGEFQLVFPPDDYVKKILYKDFQIFQFLGNSGAGKTSILNQAYSFIIENSMNPLYYLVNKKTDYYNFFCFSPDWIIFDELQFGLKKDFMKYLDIWIKCKIKIIIGSHMDHEAWFEDKYKCKTFYIGKDVREKLSLFVKKRLKFAASKNQIHEFTDKAFDELFLQCRGSIENARLICYELFLCKKLPQKINAALIKEAADVFYNTPVKEIAVK